MKKTPLLIILTWILSCTISHAQSVAAYDFESHIGTYNEITDGTVIGQNLQGAELSDRVFFSTNTSSTELMTGEGFPIGFEFSFNNTPMNRFVIGSHGYLVLGQDNITVNPNRSSFMLMDKGEGKNNIVGIGINTVTIAMENTEISYKLQGTTPNRNLTVQYKNLGMRIGWGEDYQGVDLQIRLIESTGAIQMIFKNWEINFDYNGSMAGRVGLKGSRPNDQHLRYSNTNSWLETEKVMTDRTLSWGTENFPPDGLTYTFIAPPICEVPELQPTDLSLAATTTEINGSFKENESADHYLIVMTQEPSLNTLPVNGIFYETESVLGNGIIVDYTDENEFITSTELDGTTNYYFHIFAANSYCSSGPLYNTQTPLTGSISTLPAAPQLLEEIETEYHSITIKTESNTLNNDILIGITEEPFISYGSVGQGGTFGTPYGELAIGDAIEGGGTVLYKGPATEAFKIEGLKSNNIYHLKAWSVDNNHNYSSTSIETDVLTWGTIPYENIFNKMPSFGGVFGWDVEGTIFRIAGGQLECNVQTANANGSVNSVTTQWILLEETQHRILFDYRITTWTRPTGDLPYNNWDERDIFEILISKDGENFTSLYKMDKDNAPELESASSWIKFKLSLDEYQGEKVKFRIYWKTHQVTKLIINNLFIEEEPTCDYPLNVAVDENSLIGNKGLVSWEPTGEESNWDIRYRKTDMNEWYPIIEVTTNPYLLTTLPERSEIELQVRAKCSMTSYSEWSKPITFHTGYAIPFTQLFEENALPAGWNFETGTIDNPTSFCIGTFCNRKWEIENEKLMVNYENSLNDWILLPVIDLEEGEVNYKMAIDLKRSNTGNSLPDENSYLAVVISDNEEFNEDNIVTTLLIRDLSLSSSLNWQIPLNAYTGKVKLAIYAENTTTSSDKIEIESISILESCPMEVVVEVTDITMNSAKIKWEGDAGEWFTFVRKAGENERDYQKQTANEISLTDLSPRTTYEVGITKACEENDMARVVITSFTTLPDTPCQEVEEIEVITTSYEATVTWEGEAESYNIRIRETGEEDWLITTSTDKPEIIIDGLSPGTEYEYTIQSVCSSADGDVSEWLAIAQFTTRSVSCFVPEEITFSDIKHISINITWKGEADKYEISYRKGNEAWNNQFVDAEENFLLAGLEASTLYNIRIRSICSENDISLWSSVYEVNTTAVPECAIPANLQATNITESKVLLSWEADESNLSWDLRYRPGTVTSWTVINELEESSYLLEELSPNTAYIWSVKASCDEERESAWAAQESFATLEGLGISTYENIWKVFITNNTINILNPNQVQIDYIRIYHLNGQLMNEFMIKSNENIFIPYHNDHSVIVIKIYTENFTEIHKGLIK